MRVEVPDRHRQVGIGVHQPRIGGDDAVPVGVRVVAGGQVEPVAVADQRRHRVRGGAVHPDLAVGVQRHEPPGRVHHGVDHREVQTEVLGDVLPVLHRGAAHRVGPDPDSGGPDRVEVDDVGEVVAVRRAVVEPGDLRGRLLVRQALDRRRVGDQGVRPGGDDRGGVGVGGAAVRRVVLEAAVARRVVRGGDDDAVGRGLGVGLVPVVHHDRARQRRGRGVLVLAFGPDIDAVGDQHLDRRPPCGQGQCMGVLAEVERADESLFGAVLDDRLGDRGDVGIVERPVETRATMTRGAEDDLLVGIRRVGDDVVIGGEDVVDVDEVFRKCRLTSACVSHGFIMPLVGWAGQATPEGDGTGQW
ncbi:hypothetical protein SDC9_131160 [bioreactor metagenome]|uniref:Uncharacterized protein n=1 Tax=bioreactor metagenome TaxID=1076179 RepID=A0A645D4F9_9ZZZZ